MTEEHIEMAEEIVLLLKRDYLTAHPAHLTLALLRVAGSSVDAINDMIPREVMIEGFMIAAGFSNAQIKRVQRALGDA